MIMKTTDGYSLFFILSFIHLLKQNKMQKKKPLLPEKEPEVLPQKYPEVQPIVDPDDPLIPQENPDLIPVDDPFITPPEEMPPPGEGPS